MQKFCEESYGFRLERTEYHIEVENSLYFAVSMLFEDEEGNEYLAYQLKNDPLEQEYFVLYLDNPINNIYIRIQINYFIKPKIE